MVSIERDMAYARIHTREEWEVLPEDERGRLRASLLTSRIMAMNSMEPTRTFLRLAALVEALVVGMSLLFLLQGNANPLVDSLWPQAITILLLLYCAPRPAPKEKGDDDYAQYEWLSMDTRRLADMRHRRRLLPLIVGFIAASFIAMIATLG